MHVPCNSCAVASFTHVVCHGSLHVPLFRKLTSGLLLLSDGEVGAELHHISHQLGLIFLLKFPLSVFRRRGNLAKQAANFRLLLKADALEPKEERNNNNSDPMNMLSLVSN